MFVMMDEPEFTWPVTVHVAQADGTKAAQTFTGRFRMVPVDAVEAAVATHGIGADDALMERMFLGWTEGVADAEGKPVACTPENLRQMLRRVDVRRAVTAAYWDGASGAPAKN